MKEHEFPYESFIGGWYIPQSICNNIVDYFNKKKKENLTYKGEVHNYGTVRIAKEVKDSEELEIHPHNSETPFKEYRDYLQKSLEKYLEKYTMLNKVSHFNITVGYNIQYYKKGGGFKLYHCERGALEHCSRQLVFMTYLNDIEEGGGTEFYYQKIITPAKKGLTLLWPTDWTHTHRGQVSNTEEKYIITGWFNYV